MALRIKSEYEFRKSIGYPYRKSDIKWSTHMFLKLPMYSFLSGSMAGMLGIGGGLILGPLLLDIGLHPIVSTATSGFLVLFTSSSTSIQFIIMGMMKLDYAFACTLASTVGSFLGTLLIQRLVQKTGRYSYLIFTLVIVLGISTVMIPGEALVNLIENIGDLNVLKFNSPC